MREQPSICICGPSALEAYRAHQRLAPDLLKRPRTGKVEGIALPSSTMLHDDMERLGVVNEPYHLLLKSNSASRGRTDIVARFREKPLPRTSLIEHSKGVYIVCPELLFVELAALAKYSDVELILIGYELCGTYVLDESWDKLTNTEASLTTVDKMRGYLTSASRIRGAARARKLLDYIHDGSNSPMESALAALLSMPVRKGGLGLGTPSLNHKIMTAAGEKWVDIYFEEHRIGFEYKGRESHSIEKTIRDDQRQNRLSGSGVTTLNVWYEDLTDDRLFSQLEHDILNLFGIKHKKRYKDKELEQELLRKELSGMFKTYG